MKWFLGMLTLLLISNPGFSDKKNTPTDSTPKKFKITFKPIDFINQDLITKYKIQRVQIKVLPHKDSRRDSCLMYEYRFNSKGQITVYKLLRSGSYHKFTYKNDKIFEIGWVDSTSREYTPYWNRSHGAEPDLSYGQFAARQKVETTFFDPCFSLSADYSLALIFNKKGLASQAHGTLLHDNKAFGGKSAPKDIYIFWLYQ